MTTDTSATIHAAWNEIKAAAEASTSDSGAREIDDSSIALIENGVNLLELAAAYRATVIEWGDAQKERLANRGQSAPELRYRAAERALDNAKSALINAALDLDIA